MELLTIGAFAHASRLSQKALRLYDELGLLRPAEVDPVSGYRRYAPEQLDRARLVAWLRRIGMPLARIRVVCDLPASEAAEEVAAFWRQTEDETDARRVLATFLTDYLSRKDTSPKQQIPLAIRYAVRTDRGLVRKSNMDYAHAGARVLAVADGYGGAGQAASTIAVNALRQLDSTLPAGDLLNAMQDAASRAGDAVRAVEDGGTTLTAMIWTGSQLGLVHIGDSRAYLLRAGELFQITHDHTVVQSLVDDGRLTADEVASHPQRSILLRALAKDGAAPDLRLHEVRAGDRYLLCSDGLHTVLAEGTLREVLKSVTDPEVAVARFVDLANAAGGPDNIACVVADLVAA